MKSIVILCMVCLSVVAQAQEPKLLHVNFQHAYGAVTPCPGSLAGVQGLCHYEWYPPDGNGRRVGKGWFPNESVAQADSAIQKELRAQAGQTAQSPMQGLDPNS